MNTKPPQWRLRVILDDWRRSKQGWKAIATSRLCSTQHGSRANSKQRTLQCGHASKMAYHQQASPSIRWRHMCNRNLVNSQESHLSEGTNFVPQNSSDLTAQKYYDEGNALLAQRRFVEATACYDKAIALKPDYAPAYNNRGNAFKHLQRFQEALDSYDRAIQLQPYRKELLVNRANALQGLERLEEAIGRYESVIALKPDYVEAYSNYGVALKEPCDSRTQLRALIGPCS